MDCLRIWKFGISLHSILKKCLSERRLSRKMNSMLPHKLAVLVSSVCLCASAVDVAKLVSLCPVARGHSEATACAVKGPQCCCPEACRRLKMAGKESPRRHQGDSRGEDESVRHLSQRGCLLKADCGNEKAPAFVSFLMEGLLPGFCPIFPGSQTALPVIPAHSFASEKSRGEGEE